jgi:Zn-dependent peptidase ImmA (M78 family)
VISILDHLSSRHLTFEDAAKKAGIEPDRFRAVAAGTVDTTLGEMRRIAKVLRVPLSAIVGGKDVEPIKVLFRQTLGQRAEVASSSVEVIANQIRGALLLANRLPSDLGWLKRFRDTPDDTAHVEDIAQRFRADFGGLNDADPFTSLPQVVDELGVLVLMCQDTTVEGVSAVVEGRCVVLIGPRTFRPRMLFTLAHELGHIIAHHDRREGYAMLDSTVEFDRPIEMPVRADEQFADAFASALLLPRPGVLLSLKVIRQQLRASGPLGDVEILTLARFYGVGFEVAARRCEQLDLLPPRGARALYQQLEHAHGNPEKRAEELGLPRRQEIQVETSSVLIRAASAAVREGKLSIGRAAELLNVPLSVLYAANVDAAV